MARRSARTLTRSQQHAARQMRRLRAHARQFAIPKPSPARVDPEYSLYFWHPNRFGVQFAPDAFRRCLYDLHRDLEITWHPLGQRWLVWYKKPSIQRTCGWLLLFVWEHPITHAYEPLTELVFLNLYLRSAHVFGNGKQYFDRITTELERAEQAKAEAHDSSRSDFAKDYHQYLDIKNIGRGSKYALHHDGTVVPSRGEANWEAEIAQSRLPGFIRDQMRREAERKRAYRAMLGVRE